MNAALTKSQTPVAEPRDRMSKVKSQILEILPAELHVDPEVQRFLDPNLLRTLEATWDPSLAGVLAVSRRANGDYYLIDGQHRAQAASRVTPNTPLRCEVFDGLTREEEAKRFIKANRYRKAATAYDNYRIALFAKFPAEVAIDSQLRMVGLEMGPQASSKKVGAVQACRAVYAKDKAGTSLLATTIKTLVDAWGYNRENWDAMLIQGVADLINRNSAILDHKRLVKVLGAELPHQWQARTQARLKGGGGSASRPIAMARLVKEEYNKGLRTKTKMVK